MIGVEKEVPAQATAPFVTLALPIGSSSEVKTPTIPSFAFFHVLYVTLFVLDAIYIGLLWSGRRSETASAPSRS